MDDEDLTPRWLATCLYNGSTTGAGRSVTIVVRSEDPMDAIKESWKAAARKDKSGICILGVSAVQIPDTETKL